MTVGYWTHLAGDDGRLRQAFEFHSSPTNTNITYTPGATSTDVQQATLSFWARRATWDTAHHALFSAGDATNGTQIYFNAANQLNIYVSSGGAVDLSYQTNAVYDDNSWRHYVVQFDFANGTQADRMKAYDDGVEITSWNASINNSLDTDVHHMFTNAKTMYIGSLFAGDYFDGIMADVNLVQGQLVAPSQFGQTVDSSWVWRDYSGTHGDGARLEFDPEQALGYNSAA